MEFGSIHDGQGNTSTRISQAHQDRPSRGEQQHRHEQQPAVVAVQGTLTDRDAFEQQHGLDITSPSNNSVCTIITANYLPYAKALLESVRSFDADVHFNIFISDIERHQFTEDINDRYVFFHFSDEVCRIDIGHQIRNKYQTTDHDAFRWSCKPIFINHLIRQYKYDRVLYFDCDIYIFDTFRFLFDALNTHQVLLTPHWRSKTPEIEPDEYRFLFNHGLYNAGFIGVASTATDIMDWWAGCCLFSCARGSFEGEYVDQSILNLMPVYFEGVHVLRHKGCNVAIWNRHECERVLQSDGSVKIDDVFPIVFIHFSAGIPRSWDPLIGTYLDRYLASLKKYDQQTWERELNKRNPIRDTYLEQKSEIYIRLKRSIVHIRLNWLPNAAANNIAILAQSGTSQHCLGLWLRQIPGTLLSSNPVRDWMADSIHTLDGKISGFHSPDKSGASLQTFLNDAMKGRMGDMAHVNWADWSSLIRIKRMIMNFPEGSLCWPEIAEFIGRRHQVIALISHPAPFAQRMLAIFGDGRELQCMKEAMNWIQQHPTRPSGLEEMSAAEYAWIIKWCLDIQQLQQAAKTGTRILFIREEDLMSNTRKALDQLLTELGWKSNGDMGGKFQTFCRYRHQSTHEEDIDLSLNLSRRQQALSRLMYTFYGINELYPQKMTSHAGT